MGKVFRLIGKLFALVFAILLVVSIPLAVISYDTGRVVFTPDLVEEISVEIFSGSDVIPEAMRWFSTRQAEEKTREMEGEPGETEPGIVQLIKNLDRDDWIKIQKEILPEDLVREWIRVTVDGVYGWIDNQQASPDIVWDLKPLVSNMEQNGEAVIMIAYNSLEPCTEKEIRELIQKIRTSPPGTEITYDLCRLPMDIPTPEESYGQDQMDGFLSSLQALVFNIPREIDVGKMLSSNSNADPQAALETKQQLRLLRLVMNLSPLVSLALMMLILLFGIRSLKELGKWWGIPVLLGSLISAGCVLLQGPFVNRFLSNGLLADLPLMLRPYIERIFLVLSRQIFQKVFWHSVGLFLLGIGLIVLMILARSPDQKTG